MNWLNLRTETLRCPELASADPCQLGVWLRVLAHCCEQENGGVIEGAAGWTDRQWMTACGVTQSEAKACALIRFSTSQQAIVLNYPNEKEAEVRGKREAGRRGGLAKTQAKTKAAQANGQKGGRPETQAEIAENPSETQAQTEAEPKHNPSTNPTEGEGEGNDKENENGKGKEKEPEWNPSKPPKNLPTTEPAKRIAALFRRRETTLWSDGEVKAFKKIGPIEIADLELIETYYAAERAKGDDGRHRRDLSTFLNNFAGELDRARSPKVNGKKSGQYPEEITLPML